VNTPQFDWARSRLPRTLQPVPPIFQPEAIAGEIVRAARDAPRDRWRCVRDKIHKDVCEKGFDAGLGYFVRAYGTKQLDASLLLTSVIGFLPPSDARFRATVEAIERTLLVDEFVTRYDTTQAEDGLPPGEGMFLACSFWLADAYQMMGRDQDAEKLFERLLKLRNDLGLLSEEYDPDQRRLVGNFPQAFSHISLVNTAHNLSHSKKPSNQRSGKTSNKARTPFNSKCFGPTAASI
jgi:GH15 family glucan-1,4-alpha-glucosidase